MSNFAFLAKQTEYAMFALAALEAERIYATAPAMCAVGCRKALELAVKWVYAADTDIKMPYKDNIQALIHEPSFRFALDEKTWGKLPYIIKLGNLAVHTEREVNHSDALAALQGLFEFVSWINYCYGANYEELLFEEALIPKEKIVVDTRKIKEQQSLLNEKDFEIVRLSRQVERLAESLTLDKEQHQRERRFVPVDITEFQTRKRYIDLDLKLLGWSLSGVEADVLEEYEVEGMAGKIGQKGYVDYVLFGRDGLPLAVIEAKRQSKDPNTGRKQATLYADCLERAFGRRPVMFLTNGFETYFWDDTTGPQRRVSGIFSKDNLQKLINRRSERKPLEEIAINESISGRAYQMAAIRAICENISLSFRKHLLVMATGTGKTRTAAGLVDVLSRGGHITNVLFLADRTALVKQAHEVFKNTLPAMSLCNLLSNKDDKTSRIVFSTYPTMLNSIDDAKTADGLKLFTPAHFDLIIIDESHRSIFKKYQAIFEYFDALILGLTATPKTDVDRNTYEFFDMEPGVPTYAYDYKTAVEIDKVLVPFRNYEVRLKFLEEGIVYDELSDEEKEIFQSYFEDHDSMPEAILPSLMNEFVFNQSTVDIVLQDLMAKGIKVGGGDRLGKTIIFAQNKRHAEYILERFNILYPYLRGSFAQRVMHDDSYAQTIIDDFKNPDKEPQIVISVDMMDTGIDVPECVNLVFFKRVYSKTKFWQMIGRGTRICPGLECFDIMDGAYIDKRRFFIFDYCGNFAYFREHEEGVESKETYTLTESIFHKKIRLAVCLQSSAFADEGHQAFRSKIVEDCHAQVIALNTEEILVKLKLQYVEKYKNFAAFIYLGEGDKGDLIEHLGSLVRINDDDEAAKRFDNFIYGLMLADIEATAKLKTMQNRLTTMAISLENRVSIPQIRAKLELIRRIGSGDFWQTADILTLEKIRFELRSLMKFLEDDVARAILWMELIDYMTNQTVNEPVNEPYDFEDYRKKVNRFVEQHPDNLAIHKLTHNIQLSLIDYQELERILTKELGSITDYQRVYGDTPFGLLIRQIAKLDREVAMSAFAQFINDQSLNHSQIEFVLKIVNHIAQNGYMHDLADLTKPPFDKPISFVKLFDVQRREQLVEVIKSIKSTAIVSA